jgi:hypothetical protein
MTDIIRRVEDETIFAEVETLAVIAGESAKKATQFLVVGQPTEAAGPTLDTHKGRGVFSANQRTKNEPQKTHNNCGDNPESEHDITRHTETAPTYSTTRGDRPIFILTDRSWCYLGARDAPSVQQAQIIRRPSGVYIGPFNDEVSSTENVADHNEDHNWRRKE